MAQRFNLTAQLQVQANRGDINRTVQQIKKQLQPLGNVKLNVQTNAKSLAQANKQVQNFNKGIKASAKSTSELNKTLAESARRFSVITVATGTLLSLVNAFKRSTKEAIAFELELVKISQVTGKIVPRLSGLSDEVTRLSTSLGASSADLLNVSRTLLQTGLSAQKTTKALDILAKTTLAATFNDIQSTTEGAIAVLNQFSTSAAKTGGEIKFLEKTLDSINAVSKNFAVESADLVTAIRRVGGVFANAGGEVNELIALFTSVRQTTRESAETIATGLRTIFTRIQRQDTVDALKELGINLQDAEGNFVGAFEAVKRLSSGLSGLDPRNYRFAAIVEQLGGFRQVGKVIPLINQFTVAQQALNVAQGAAGSINKDAQTAQQALATEIAKTREQFDAFIRKLTDSSAFRSVITGSLKLAQALIKIGEALEPVLPLLTTLFALKAGQGLAKGIGILRGFGGASSGIRATKFNRGGPVPGSGNRDTVPAMLTPGEFVIRKSSVKKLGMSTLAAMNENRFQDGGLQKRLATKQGAKVGSGAGVAAGAILRTAGDKTPGDGVLSIGGAFLQPQGIVKSIDANVPSSAFLKKAKEGLGGGASGGAKDLSATDAAKIAQIGNSIKIRINSGSLGDEVSTKFRKGIENSLTEYSREFASVNIGTQPSFNQQRFRQGFKRSNIEQIEGGIFESFLNGLSRTPFNENKIQANDIFDFPSGLGSSSSLFKLDQSIPTDAKRTFNQDALNSLTKKGSNRLLEAARVTLATQISAGKTGGVGGSTQAAARAKVLKRNKGGGISGQDTVPALLTPGEFVFNKSAAQSIGYSNLNKMNKQGVQGFNKGGTVGFKRFAAGGPTGAGLGLSTTNVGSLEAVAGALDRIGVSAGKTEQSTARYAEVINVASQELLAGASDAEAFDKAFAKLRDSSKAAKKATEEQAKAEEKRTQARKNDPASRKADIKAGLSQKGQTQVKDIQSIKSFAQNTQQASRAVDVYKKAVASGASTQEAYKRAQQSLISQSQSASSSIGFFAKKQQEAGKESTTLVQRFKNLSAAVAQSAVGQRAGKLAGGAKQVGQGVAQNIGNLQQFAFLAASIGAVVGSLGAFDDATNKALTESLGFGAGLAGIAGTFAQLFTAQAANTASTVANTTSEELETQANLKSAASENTKSGVVKGFTGALTGAIVGVGVAVTALKFFSARAKALADKAKKDFDAGFKEIAETGSGNANKLKAAAATEVLQRQKAAKSFENDALAIAGGSAAAGAIAGAAIGSFVPILGTAVGGLVGGLVGAGIGVAAALGGVEAELSAEQQARQREIEAINASIDALVGFTATTANAKANLATIEQSEGLSDERKSELRREQVGNLLTQGGGSAAASFDATREIRSLSRATGKSEAELAALDDDALTTLFKKSGIKQYSAAVVKLRVATKQQSQAAERSKTALQESAKTFSDELSRAPVGKTFSQLVAEGGSFAKALKQRQEALRQANQIEIQAAEDKIFDASNIKDSEQRTKEVAKAQAQLAEVQKRARQSQQLLIEGAKNTIKTRNDEFKAIQDETKARIALDRILRQQAQELNAINQLNKELQAAGDSIRDFTDVLNGNIPSLRVGKPEVGADVPVGQLGQNLNEFVSTLDQLPPKFQAAGQKAAQALFNNAKLIDEGSQRLVKLDEINLEGLSSATPDEILNKIGLTDNILKNALGGDGAAVDAFKDQLKEAAKDGIIGPEEAKNLFAPVAEASEGYRQQIEGLSSAVQQGLDNYKAQLEAEQAVRDKQVAAVEKFNSVAEKSSDVLASAFGGSSAVARGAAERQSRQRVLDAGAAARGGVSLQAGDAKQLAAAKKFADVQQKLVAAELARLRNIPGTIKQQKALQKELKQLQNTSKDAAAALLEVAESSAKIDALKESLDAAAQSREQRFDILKDFVIAGQEGRNELRKAANGILSAVTTGTLQNQSPEDRQATFALLDRLSDVVIGNTGLTGKQIQQELVFRDAINLGFPPELAKELATSTSIEEQILTELQKQTNIQLQNAKIGAAPVFSTGGVVYRADGGSIFKPKGTDTVPAMLTPGEFVIRKSAVDKIGVGNLQALNNGGGTVYRSNGGPVYRQNGGGINLGNAQVAGGRVQILSGDQFRQILATGLRNVIPNTGVFKKLLEESGYDRKTAGDIVGKTRNLGRAGLIETGRFGGKAAQDVATGLNFLSSEGPKLFAEAGGNGVVIRNGKTVEDYTKDYRPTLTNTINALYGKNGTFVNQVVKASSGFDFRARLQTLREAADNAVSKVGGKQSVEAAKTLGNIDFTKKTLRDEEARNFAGKLTPRIQAVLNAINAGKSGLINVDKRNNRTLISDAASRILDVSGARGEKNVLGTKTFGEIAKFAGNPSADAIKSGITDPKEYAKIFQGLKITPADIINWALVGPKQDPFSVGSLQRRKEFAEKRLQKGAKEVAGGQFGEGGPKKKLPGKFQADLDFLRATGLYLAQGSGVQGADTVPAMLTPGEFVMSPEAVRKYGTGYMKQLNKGQVPGFRRGGLVGSTKYLANGGDAGSGGGMTLSIDTTNIQSVFGDFGAALKENLDNIVNSFSSLTTSMETLAAAFGNGITMTHEFTGDMKLAFKLENGDTLKTAIAESMTPVIVEKITAEIDRRLDSKDFKAG